MTLIPSYDTKYREFSKLVRESTAKVRAVARWRPQDLTVERARHYALMLVVNHTLPVLAMCRP